MLFLCRQNSSIKRACSNFGFSSIWMSGSWQIFPPSKSVLNCSWGLLEVSQHQTRATTQSDAFFPSCRAHGPQPGLVRISGQVCNNGHSTRLDLPYINYLRCQYPPRSRCPTISRKKTLSNFQMHVLLCSISRVASILFSIDRHGQTWDSYHNHDFPILTHQLLWDIYITTVSTFE